METNIATAEEILTEIEKDDFSLILKRLEFFVFSYTQNAQLSRTPFDIVADILAKVLEEDGPERRRWNKEKYPTFQKFLFSAVRSHIHNILTKSKNRREAQKEFQFLFSGYFYSEKEFEKVDNEMIKNEALKCLYSLSPTPEEEFILELWLDGTNKPIAIAELLEITVNEVNQATRRLQRKLPKIQKCLKPYLV